MRKFLSVILVILICVFFFSEEAFSESIKSRKHDIEKIFRKAKSRLLKIEKILNKKEAELKKTEKEIAELDKKAESLMEKGEYEKAKKIYEKILKISEDPNFEYYNKKEEAENLSQGKIEEEVKEEVTTEEWKPKKAERKVFIEEK